MLGVPLLSLVGIVVLLGAMLVGCWDWLCLFGVMWAGNSGSCWNILAGRCVLVKFGDVWWLSRERNLSRHMC